MALSEVHKTKVRYVRSTGCAVATTLAEVDVESVVRGLPARRVRSRSGQRHYSGLYWSSTTGAHLGYESCLEMDRLLLADFDSEVEWIATQPMWLCGPDGSTNRRHVPDLLLRLTGDRYVVADVKPAEFAELPDVSAVFEWTGLLCAARGWGYEVWSGSEPALLANRRFLAAGRRRELVHPAVLRVVRDVASSGMTFGEIEATAERAGASREATQPAMLAMLWAGMLTVNLRYPLTSETVIEPLEAA